MPSGETCEEVVGAGDVDDLLDKTRALRDRLLTRRAALVSEVEDIDRQLARLPGWVAPSPPVVDPDGWEVRRERLRVASVGRSGQPLNARDVVHAVATFYGVATSRVLSADRHKTIAHVRHVAMFLARRLTPDSYPELGRLFGRDPTTVIAGENKVEELLGQDPALRLEVEEIERVLSERGRNPGSESGGERGIGRP